MIGVLSIISGIGGALLGLVNMTSVHHVFGRYRWPGGADSLGASLAVAVGILQIVASIVLVVGGVWLWRARRVGVWLHYVGAAGRLAAFAAHAVVTVRLARLGEMGPYWITSTALGALLGAVYPVFVLVWLVQQAVRKTTRRWS